METQYYPGQKWKLKNDRGLSKVGDILTIDRITDGQVVMIEMFNKTDQHYLLHSEISFIAELVEEDYQIY